MRKFLFFVWYLSRIRRRATALDESACLGMAERNDVGPKGDQCHDSRSDCESMKYVKAERVDPSWAAQEGQLLIPASNLDLISGMRSTGTSMDNFARGVGVGLTHTE